jgi:hypothetical protein
MTETCFKARQQFHVNLRAARRLWPHQIQKPQAESLETLSARYLFSVALGDLLYLEGRWYVTHAGLLRLATCNRCSAIRVQPVRQYCDPAVGRWVFRATVYKTPRSKGFVGYGDADPTNVSSLVRGAEMRVAETRAVNRALRKAYGIGLCSVEELGSFSIATNPVRAHRSAEQHSGNGQPRLRDRLCLLIRQHQLDPNLVKRYAAEFCETENLRAAGREKIEAFIQHLAEWASKDREGLLETPAKEHCGPGLFLPPAL